MAYRKIAITVPPDFLTELDSWAKRTGKSRSRFIVEQLAKRIQELEDEYITKLFDTTYGDRESTTENVELAEEMLSLAPSEDQDEQW